MAVKTPKVPIMSVVDGPIISAGDFLSSAVDCTSGALFKIWMPDEWTAAPITFETSVDNTTYRDVFDTEGKEMQFTVFPSTVVLIPNRFVVGWIKIRSGTRDAPVVQPAERKFCLILGR